MTALIPRCPVRSGIDPSAQCDALEGHAGFHEYSAPRPCSASELGYCDIHDAPWALAEDRCDLADGDLDPDVLVQAEMIRNGQSVLGPR